MFYLVYNKQTGLINYITNTQEQVFTDATTDVLIVDELPEWYNDITKRPKVINNQLIEDETYIYLTPEQLHLQNIKQQKFEEIKQQFMQQFIDGHFYSQAVAMEVDYRRYAHNNDLQNLESLIEIMQLSNINTINFKGYTEEKIVTIEQLQQLVLEMKQRGLWLYQRKWAIEERVQQAQTIEEVNNVIIDFISENYI